VHDCGCCDLGAEDVVRKILKETGLLAERRGYEATASKYLEEAERAKREGKEDEARRLLKMAGENFEKAGELAERAKSYKAAAEHFCKAAFAYISAGDEGRAKGLMIRVSDLLANVAKDYLAWGESNKAAAFSLVAVIILSSLDMDSKAADILKWAKSQIKEGAKARMLLNIGDKVISAVKSGNLNALTEAQMEVTAHLKPLLSVVRGLELSNAIDRAFELLNERLKGRTAIPQLSLSLDGPSSVVPGTEFNISVNIVNSGRGKASNVILRLESLDGFEVKSPGSEILIGDIGAGERVTREFTLFAGKNVPPGRRSIKVGMEFMDPFEMKYHMSGTLTITVTTSEEDALKSITSELEKRVKNLGDKAKMLPELLRTALSPILDIPSWLLSEIKYGIGRKMYPEVRLLINMTEEIIKRFEEVLTKNLEGVFEKLASEIRKNAASAIKERISRAVDTALKDIIGE